MPIEIGRPPCDIFKYHNGYKAVEWRNWIILFSLPLLKVYLDKRHLQGWANFVKAVKLYYYEREYYQNNGQRLAASIFKEKPLKQWSKERVFSTEGNGG
ncbi:unnamed protein product [Rhizophagus irregularis]|nr:unnamed protein product [Rhizophagus irregularis]